MKEKIKKSSLTYPCVLLLLAALFYAATYVEFFDSLVIIHLCGMVAQVLLAERLAVMFLGWLKPKTHRGRTLATILSSLMKYLAAVVILCYGLTIMGVDVSTIVTSMGIIALVVGFGAESLITDVVTGVFMLFENQYNVGDIVEVNGFRGTVHEIGIRTTSIIDIGGNIKVVNNAEMKNLLNRSDNSSRAVCDISIPYETDIEAFEGRLPELLEDIFQRHRDVMKSAPIYLGVQALEASGVLLRFCAEVPEKEIYNAARILNHDLLIGFKSLGVECPYPQLDMHSR